MTAKKGEWLLAGDYLARRIEVAAKAGDWRGDWIESDIITELSIGELEARGRPLGWRKRRATADEIAILPGADTKTEWLPVASIDVAFWKDVIFFSGVRHPGGSNANWPENMFNCGSIYWSDVEIFAAATKRVGGRPPKYDWQALNSFLINLLADEGGLSPDYNQASLERAALDYAQQEWGKTPAESLVRGHVKLAVRAHEQAKSAY